MSLRTTLRIAGIVVGAEALFVLLIILTATMCEHRSHTPSASPTPAWEVQKCSRCGGSGATRTYVPIEAPCRWCASSGWMYFCPTCGGSGTAIDPDTLYPRQCYRCWGSGVKSCDHCLDGQVTIGGSWVQERCPECGGTGQRWVQK